MKTLVLKLLLLFLMINSGLSQSSSTVSGRVSDGNSFLPGVSITIQNTQKGAVTDLDGRFLLTNLAPGVITLEFSYLSFEKLVKEFILETGTNHLGLIQLSESNTALSEIIVKGTMAPSQLKALSIKKSSPAIMDVLASDAIGKLPDRNAAEAVQRLPSVSVNRYHGEANQVSVRGTPYGWSSTLYNGTRLPSANLFGGRNAVLDAIPSEMIQYVLLSKSITPDMEGDAIGGSINFITRSAPESRTLNASIAGGYNQRSQNGTYNGSIVYGDRLFNNKLGFVVSASIWDRNFAADEQVVDYNIADPDPTKKYSIATINAKRYFGKRRTAAVNAGMEYEFNSGNKLFARFVRDRFDDIRPVYEAFYEFDRRRYRYSYRYSEYKTDLDGFELGGVHQISSKLKLDWTASSYDMQFRIETPPFLPENQKGLPIAQFFQRLSGEFGSKSSNGKYYTQFDSPDGVGIDLNFVNPGLTNPEDVMDARRLLLTQLIIFNLETRERDQVGQLNLLYEPTNKVKIKFGGKYRDKLIRNALVPLVFLPDAALGIPGAPALKSLADFNREPYPIAGGLLNELNNPFDNLILDHITKQQLFDIFSPEFFTANGIKDRSAISNVTARFNGFERVAAGYGMAIVDLTDKLSMTAGFRNEYTWVQLNGSQLDASNNNKITELTRDFSYNAFLPMVNLKYRLSENTNLRGAFNRTFSRPNVPDLNPGENIDNTLGFPRITRGNSSLRPTFSNNFDLLGEVFLQDIGIITGGVFYKQISDYIFRDRSTTTIGGIDYLVIQPNNLENAFLLGFETGITKRFTELPGFWGGFGVDANYTFIKSELQVPRQVDGTMIIEKTTLPNQSKNLFNTSIFYEKKGLMLRLAANYRGPAVESINQDLGSDFYVFVDKNLTVDLSGAYGINKNLKVFVEIRNLTNEPFVQYLGNDRRRQTSSEWFSISGQAGVRFNIF
jgi:TonB-dependent receptor